MNRYTRSTLRNLSFKTRNLFLITASLLSANVALAQVSREASSVVSGVSFPQGGQPWNKADKQFASLLVDLAKQPGVRREIKGAIKTLVWSGERYREDRVPFLKSATQRTLEGAGFALRFLDETEDIHYLNIFTHFPSDEENPPFQPSLTKKTVYFLADNASKGESILGVWMESNDSLALSIAPLTYVAKAIPKPLPPVASGAILIKDHNDTMKGLPPLSMPNFPPVSRKPRTIRGWIRDSGGKPISHAEVAAFCSVGGGFRTTHTARSNAQGFYEVLLPVGVAEIAEATAKVSYNGVTYELPLRPAGQSSGGFKAFNSQQGQVQNFYLQTTGESGGTIRLVTNKRNGTLEVTLTPVGRALDGSQRAFVYRIPADKDNETYINGVPIGRYTLTAQLLDNGETLPLRTHLLGYPLDSATSSLQIDFKPGYDRMESNPGKSNSRLVPFQLGLTP